MANTTTIRRRVFVLVVAEEIEEPAGGKDSGRYHRLRRALPAAAIARALPAFEADRESEPPPSERRVA